MKTQEPRSSDMYMYLRIQGPWHEDQCYFTDLSFEKQNSFLLIKNRPTIFMF